MSLFLLLILMIMIICKIRFCIVWLWRLLVYIKVNGFYLDGICGDVLVC